MEGVYLLDKKRNEKTSLKRKYNIDYMLANLI